VLTKKRELQLLALGIRRTPGTRENTKVGMPSGGGRTGHKTLTHPQKGRERWPEGGQEDLRSGEQKKSTALPWK